MKFQSSGLTKLPAIFLLLVGMAGFWAQNALAQVCQHGVPYGQECPKCRAMYGGGSSSGGNFNSGPSQQQIQQQQEQARAAAEKKAQEEAEEQARQEAAVREAARKKAAHDAEVARDFQKRKTEAMREMKGIETGLTDAGGGGLKGLDDVATTPGGLKVTANDTGLKGLDEPAKPAPAVVTDSRVVDARNVPSGLPKGVDNAIAAEYASAPPGVSDRVRKGFQAVMTRDWKVAKAWFEDALNHDPGNPDLKRLVALADYTETGKVQKPAPAAAPKVTEKPFTDEDIPPDADKRTYALTSTKRHSHEAWMKFLFPKSPAPTSGKLILPKDSDLELLFPAEPPDNIPYFMRFFQNR